MERLGFLDVEHWYIEEYADMYAHGKNFLIGKTMLVQTHCSM
nr:MAG TPA: hypothetical protein [Bacteriophage sp.]